MPRGRPKKKELELFEMVQESADLEKQEVELVSVEEVEIMSMTQLHQEKAELEKLLERTKLKIDKARIQQAVKIIEAMDSALDKMIGYYDKNGNLVEITPLDFKLLTEGYKNLMNSYNLVTRLDSVDTGGKAGRLSLKIEFDV